jgi:hypothetical protein
MKKILIVFFIMVSIVVLTSCASTPKVCTEYAQKCEGDKIMACVSHGTIWETVHDCSLYSEPKKCNFDSNNKYFCE